VEWLNTCEDSAPFFIRYDQFLIAFKEHACCPCPEPEGRCACTNQYLVRTRALMEGKTTESRGVIYEPAMIHVHNTVAPQPSWTAEGWCITVARKFVNCVFPRAELHGLHPDHLCPAFMNIVFTHFNESELTDTSGWKEDSGLPRQTQYSIWQLFLSDMGDLLFPMNYLHTFKRMMSVTGPTNSVSYIIPYIPMRIHMFN